MLPAHSYSDALQSARQGSPGAARTLYQQLARDDLDDAQRVELFAELPNYPSPQALKLASKALLKERLFHVGRLDTDTEGIIILTNDGDFGHKLSHPSFEIDKTYLAEVDGIVSVVSADTTQDPKTGASYYTVHIKLPPEQLARLGAVRLVPGMPVEAFVQTNARTVMSYLIRPMREQVMRAFREK